MHHCHLTTYCVRTVFWQLFTSINLSAKSCPWQQTRSLHCRTVPYKLSQMKSCGDRAIEVMALVCRASVDNNQNRRGKVGTYIHISRDSHSCICSSTFSYTQKLSAQNVETQARVDIYWETLIHTVTRWGAGCESSVTVISFKQTEGFCLVLLNVWQRQMQTHHSS